MNEDAIKWVGEAWGRACWVGWAQSSLWDILEIQVESTSQYDTSLEFRWEMRVLEWSRIYLVFKVRNVWDHPVNECIQRREEDKEWALRHHHLRGHQGKNVSMETEVAGKSGKPDVPEDNWRQNFRKERLITSVKNFWEVKKENGQEIIMNLSRQMSLAPLMNVVAQEWWGQTPDGGGSG